MRGAIQTHSGVSSQSQTACSARVASWGVHLLASPRNCLHAHASSEWIITCALALPACALQHIQHMQQVCDELGKELLNKSCFC